MKFRFPIIIIDEDFRSENISGSGIRDLAVAIEGEGIDYGAAKEPSRKLVAEWVLEVYNNFPAQTARNAWMKKWYEWF